MIIVGVRFKSVGKIYYFDPGGLDVPANTPVIVETIRGIEYGRAVLPNREIDVDAAAVPLPLKKVIRIATPDDTRQEEANRKREQDAFGVCLDKIRRHNPGMCLVDVELTFDMSKIIFYFTADGRVDFRDLVKDLAAVFRMRIELRQIGVRDEAKILNGIGICGRPLCCAAFLEEFQPVSIKMAKEQGLSLNPSKISGICGRLMCCLKYEEETYEFLNRGLPGVGDVVRTPDGNGEVMTVNVLRQLVKAAVQKKKNEDPVVSVYAVGEITILERRASSENAYEPSDHARERKHRSSYDR